jgi:hypothetical protein
VSLARFRWIVLTGQPGAGKTRMAMELARARVRREVLDDPPERLAPAQQRQRWRAARRLRLGAWWRNAIPWTARRDRSVARAPYGVPWHGCDPWDAWWLIAADVIGRPHRGQRGRFDPGLLGRLSAWRPRCPTVLLLDDPLKDDAREVVTTLLRAEARYRHPVRLLVVSQTLSVDLDIRESDGAWSSAFRDFIGDVLKLDGDAALGPAEVRMMDGFLGRRMEEFYRNQPGQRQPIAWKPDTASVDRLLRRTAGNALLVGLALYRVYRYPSQPEVPRETLLGERAEQIVDALRVASVEPEGILAITAATLAGPHAGPSLGALTKETRFDPERLNLVPNLYHLPAPAPPLVQPEPIGDAFVRYVLAEKRCAPDRRQQVIAAAWQAAANGEDPAAMLRTARRLAVGGDRLARALREGPPPGAGLDELTVALAHAQWAVQIPRADWDQGNVPGPAPFPALPGGYVETMADAEDAERYADLRSHASEALRLALERVQALAPGIAAAALGRFVSFLELDNTVAIVRGETALACVAALVANGLKDEEAWQDVASAGEALNALTRFFSAMRRWGIAFKRYESTGVPSVLGELVRRSAAALHPERDGVQRAEALARSAWRSGVSVANATVLYALSAAASSHEASSVARASRFSAMAGMLRVDTEAAEEAAWRVDEIARPFVDDRSFEFERAQAWSCVCSTRWADVGRCETAARRVDEIVRPFAGDPAFELQRVQSWGCVCSVRWMDSLRCETAARHVDEIARPFGGDPEFEYERAQAWHWVCSARWRDATGCEAAARQVDEIARPFAGDRAFEHERTQTWRSVCSALEDATACEAAARHVDEIVCPFAGERAFEHERAQAWRSVCSSREADPAGCEAAARRVDDLARPFAGDRSFEFERAEAWCFVCSAEKADPARCEAAARRVDDLAHPFAGDRSFELQRANAWGCVCSARREDDPVRCEAAAHRVEDIARPFPGDRDFEHQRAQAWRFIGYARRADPAGCEAAALCVDDLARPFAGDHGFEFQRAQAWKFVVYARRADPAGCEAAAQCVDEVAHPFAGDRDFEFQRAQAWVCVCSAREADPAGCQAAALFVDDLARPFSGDRDFELQRALAWRIVGFAPPNLPAGTWQRAGLILASSHVAVATQDMDRRRE